MSWPASSETLFSSFPFCFLHLKSLFFSLLFLPNVGPDVKYLLGFIRTQLSTTVTIILVFGPKFYLVARGRGDEHDPRAKAKGVTASFSLNGISVPSAGGPSINEEPDEPIDLCRENEELKVSDDKDQDTPKHHQHPDL